MGQRYTYPKSEFMKAEDVEEIKIVFTNGDYLTLDQKEIDSISLSLCDKLVTVGDKVCFRAGGGRVVCKIKNTPLRSYGAFLHDPAAYKKERKKYIETRCTLPEEIVALSLVDENNWNFPVYGRICGHMEEHLLILEFDQFGETEKKDAYIDLKDITNEKDIRSIGLDFENCDGFTIYSNEIVKIDLQFKKKLEWGGGSLNRVVTSGLLIFQLYKVFKERRVFLLDGGTSSRILTRRICPKRGADVHDLCHLYIELSDGALGQREECVELPEIRPDDVMDPLWDAYDQDENAPYPGYWGGYAKRLPGNRIAVTFGKNAKQRIDLL